MFFNNHRVKTTRDQHRFGSLVYIIGEWLAGDVFSRIPEDLLREVVKNSGRSRGHRGGKKPYPSNRDVEHAVLEVTGGVINRDLMDYLYDEALRLLSEKGFDPRHVTERRFWRIVTLMIKKGWLRLV